MKKELLRKVQLAQLDILKEVKRVCEMNNIHYFLDSGTLLGAVRHKGFIPWDDDLDIGMLCGEYEKFVAIAPKELRNDYYLETWDNDPAYPFPFAKIMKMNTLYIEDAFEDSGKRNGIYIDIFPYFPYVNDKHKSIRISRNIEHYRRLEYMISGMKPWVRHKNPLERVLVKTKYFPAYVAARFMNKEEINKRYYEQLNKMHELEDDFTYYVPGGISKYGKWRIPKECFRQYVLLDFEDDKFSCPIGYDKYLRSAYGDYMKLPPENQRENRHHIIEVKL